MAEKRVTRERPIWWSRQNIESLTLSEEEAWEIINSPPWYCVVAWVTKDCTPVACTMAYLVIDGKIVLTSTSNRDKIKAWRRNPAISICFQATGLKQVTVRGHVQISDDRALMRRWVEAHVGSWGRPMTPEERELAINRYESPDRLMIIVHLEKMRTFNGDRMFRAEQGDREVRSPTR